MAGYDEAHHSLPGGFGEITDLASSQFVPGAVAPDYRGLAEAPEPVATYAGLRDNGLPAGTGADFRIATTTSSAVFQQQLGRPLRSPGTGTSFDTAIIDEAHHAEAPEISQRQPGFTDAAGNLQQAADELRRRLPRLLMPKTIEGEVESTISPDPNAKTDSNELPPAGSTAVADLAKSYQLPGETLRKILDQLDRPPEVITGEVVEPNPQQPTEREG